MNTNRHESKPAEKPQIHPERGFDSWSKTLRRPAEVPGPVLKIETAESRQGQLKPKPERAITFKRDCACRDMPVKTREI